MDISAPSPISHGADAIDENHLLYGNFIGVQFIFADHIDAETLAQAIAILLKEMPALAGVADLANFKIVPATETIVLTVQPDYPGAALDHAAIGTLQPRRLAFISEPPRRAVLSGKANLSTFTLTNFRNGGSILGIAISHLLMDAAGFHLTVQRLGAIYSALIGDSDIPKNDLTTQLDIFKFGTMQSDKAIKKRLETSDFTMPAKLKGPLGRLIKSLIIRALDMPARRKRELIYFTPEQIIRLKETVTRESGEPWISTNIALGAHFIKIMAMLQYGDTPKVTAQIGQLLDLRGRYFTDDVARQKNYVGNAIYIYSDRFEFPDGIQFTERGQIARALKTMQAEINADFLKKRLDLTADSLRIGRTYPGLDMKNPMIAFNNQSKMPVYDAAFGHHKLLRVIPQDVGDHIMFFPAPNGGVEIYLRDLLKPERQTELRSGIWQERLYDF